MLGCSRARGLQKRRKPHLEEIFNWVDGCFLSCLCRVSPDDAACNPGLWGMSLRSSPRRVSATGQWMLSEEQGFWISPPNMRLELQHEEQGFGLTVHVCGLVMCLTWGACLRAELRMLRKG